jgi:predicted dehydrogenase
MIGRGDHGISQHLPALLRSDRVQPEAVADLFPVNRLRATQLLAGGATEVAASAEDVLDRVSDAVVIATPPWVTPKPR